MKKIDIIEAIFKNHLFTKTTDLKIEMFPKTERYSNSEGIRFENEILIGEFFAYEYNSKYCELEYAEVKTSEHFCSVIDFKNENDLSQIINDFLDQRLTEYDNAKKN